MSKKVEKVLNAKISEQVELVMQESVELQCEIAGSMPYHNFELLSFEERKSHVENALVQMPSEILKEIIDKY